MNEISEEIRRQIESVTNKKSSKVRDCSASKVSCIFYGEVHIHVQIAQNKEITEE